MDKSDGATFSQLTYQMLNNNSKSQNIDNINNTLQEEGLSNWYISPELSGKDISTFVNETTKQVVIAHRGTDTSGRKTKNDISSDVLLGLGAEENSKAFNKRKNRTEAIIKAIPEDYKIFGSGHSLGGATMGYTLENSKLARNRIEKVRLYNAGASPFQSQISAKKKSILDEKVVFHRTRNDAVSASLLINPRYGKIKTQDTKMSSLTKYVPGHLGYIFSGAESLDAHKLHHFKKNK